MQSPNPAISYALIRAQFLRGQLDEAWQAASSQKLRLLAVDRPWSFKFCLLEAEVLQAKALSQQVINTLQAQDRTFSNPDTTYLPRADLKIKRDILLSLAYARLGQQQRSTAELQDAQRLSRATHSPLQGEVLRTQGLLQNRDGQQAAAQRSFLASLNIARKQGDQYLEASDLLNLGTVGLKTERIGEALDRFNASAHLAQKLHADVLLQEDQGNAGWADFLLGDFDGALESFNQARVQARKLGATDNEILWLRNAGLAEFRVGDFTQAKARYEEALRAAQVLRSTARLAEIETSLSWLFLQLQQLDAARAHAERAQSAAHQNGDKASILDASLSLALIAARTSSGPNPERMLSQVLQDRKSTPSVRWEAEDALASVYAARHLPVQAESWHRKAIRTFETQRNSVQGLTQRLPFFANGDELYRDYADFLIASNRPDDALRLLNSARARTLQEGLGSQEGLGNRTAATNARPYKLDAAVRQRGTPILFYSIGLKRSYLWAVGAGATHLFLLPPSAEIATHVKNYQASILKSRDPIADQDADSLWLYDKLVAPAEALIPNAARVLIIPDGPLNGFNLETLLKRGPQGLHYWMEEVSLTTSTSIRLLAATDALKPSKENAGGTAEKLLLIGDPLPASSDYAALPHAAAEVESVQHYFPTDHHTTLTHAAAVPKAYAASRPHQYTYLHFVAHGVASRLRPLDSAIILSSSPTDPDHFKLYARDIMREPLNARLVTISACYGSGVRNYTGEGLVGLSWAFLRAGAHQVIGALWEVNDSSTPQLMDQLYHGLAEGEQPDRALRAAKLNMLHSTGVFRKPLYWAAFQLYAGS